MLRTTDMRIPNAFASGRMFEKLINAFPPCILYKVAWHVSQRKMARRRGEAYFILFLITHNKQSRSSWKVLRMNLHHIFLEPRFNRGIAIPCRELCGSSFPDAGLHNVKDGRASLHGGGQNSLKGVDRHAAFTLRKDDRPTLWHGSTR